MPAWYENTVFYHIYPIGLLGAPRRNEGGETVHRLRELDRWIPHLKDLSVGAVYIGPLFESGSHGYDTTDYRTVDRRLGDNEDFARFVKACHEAGIRVVVDGVFNHTGRGFFAFQDIQKNREQSRYKDWYKGINFGWNSAYNDGFSYESWRGAADLVNLNFWNQEVKDYLLDVVRFWIDTFDIDGIRLDCADVLDFDFQSQLRRMTDSYRPGFWLMGEVIHGDYARWANDGMLHSVTNYELNKGLWSGHNDHNYFEIAHTIRRQFDENGGIYRGRVLYSFADNHDVSRVVNLLRDRRHVKPLYTLLYTLPGDPSIYYGSEWGISGDKSEGDDALRPAIHLEDMYSCGAAYGRDGSDGASSGGAEEGGRVGRTEGKALMPELETYLEQLGRIRTGNPVIGTGRYRELVLTNRQYAFARIADSEAVICAVNNDGNPVQMWIPIPLQDKRITNLFTGEEVSPENGQLHTELEACGSGLWLIR